MVVRRPASITLRLLTLAAAVSTSGLSTAGDAALVVARVGETTITTSDIERRRLATPKASYGGPRRVLEQQLVPELVSSLEARARGLDKSPRYVDQEREILRQALDAALKREVLQEKPITQDELKAYFEENKSRFEQPLRIRIWRILLDDEASALRVLEQAKAAGTPAKWSELSRESSVDKATNLRQGDLGFVHPDGMTDAPRVRVDAALFNAAKRLKDGELAQKPVKEGEKFAVLWRRGSLPAKSRTLEQEKEAIRGLLERRRLETARAELSQRLRSAAVKDEHPELVDEIPDGVFGDKAARPRPSTLPNRALPGLKLPQKTADGLR